MAVNGRRLTNGCVTEKELVTSVRLIQEGYRPVRRKRNVATGPSIKIKGLNPHRELINASNKDLIAHNRKLLDLPVRLGNNVAPVPWRGISQVDPNNSAIGSCEICASEKLVVYKERCEAAFDILEQHLRR